MTLTIEFQLDEPDLERFRDRFRARRSATPRRDLLPVMRGRMQAALARDVPAFVRQRIERLDRLSEMVEDEAWGLPPQDRERIMDVLAYFAAPDDLIDDSLPALGLIDDAIAIELALRSLRPELEAYEEFSQFRESEKRRREHAGKPTEISKEDWLADRRAALHTRLHERRMADTEGWHTITLYVND